MINM